MVAFLLCFFEALGVNKNMKNKKSHGKFRGIIFYKS